MEPTVADDRFVKPDDRLGSHSQSPGPRGSAVPREREMMQDAEPRPLLGAVAPGRHWAALGPVRGLLIATALVVFVAVLDYSTGYELRLAVLYLLPIALASWTGGWRPGVTIVALSGLCWFMSFRSAHVYAHDMFFYWDGAVMLASFMVIVLLLERLRVALARADERFVRVLEELHAAVYVVDEDASAILYANRRLTRMMNRELPLLKVDDLERRFGGAIPASADGTSSTFPEPPETGFCSREICDTSTSRWYLVQTGPIPWNHNRRVNLNVITDISEQRHAQLLKRQHQEMLHHTARLAALAEIASCLAHEINQPLMAIASYNDACLRLLGGESFDESEIVAALEKSRAQAMRAAQIIHRMRDFIRSRHPQPTLCDVNAVVHESVDLMETQIEDNAVRVRLALALDLPRRNADRILLIQVVVNLIQNAVEAMHSVAPYRRQLTISTAADTERAIVVSVADQGEGVSETIKDRLYMPFSTTKTHGLGLGLSICRSVVEAHGGRLWYGANSGPGCTFHFTIPMESE